MPTEIKYYSSGEFAKLAGVTIRTVRYYDKKNILNPSLIKDSGARLYTDSDLIRLQQILFFKKIGLSLDDIKDMSITESDGKHFRQTLNIQKKIMLSQIEKMQQVIDVIDNMLESLEESENTEWSKVLDLIRLTGKADAYKEQYLDSSNLSARIELHKMFSQNPEGWYPWIYKKMNIRTGMKILEVGCGDGTLWKDNFRKLNLIPGNIKIILSDQSEGMLNDTKRELGFNGGRFVFEKFDCEAIPYIENTFDIVIANHVLFYCSDIDKAISEINRVLKPGGRLICSTYGKNHMKEITELVKKYNSNIKLSDIKLYDVFGKENGKEILKSKFQSIEWFQYEDHLIVDEVEPLIAYILSCHGNQGKYISENYSDFRKFVKMHTDNRFVISKDVGVFSCVNI